MSWPRRAPGCWVICSQVGAIDGENERIVEDADIEPVGQDHLDAQRAGIGLEPIDPPWRLRASILLTLPLTTGGTSTIA